MVSIIYKGIRKIFEKCINVIYTPLAKIAFFLNGVKINKGLRVYGIIKVYITRRGIVNIGNNLSINSGFRHNIIGRQQKCIFWVEGELTIGNNVGISSAAIICNHKITIGNNVLLGGNTVIYDTDFHSLDPQQRGVAGLDRLNAKKAPVVIGNNVFIGAHTTILKGVTIGENSIIGACSVVTKNIPDNEIWAGNPAKFVKKVSFTGEASSAAF
jgi:acetyltransferase-like isoleucine patch superfamily enzyme